MLIDHFLQRDGKTNSGALVIHIRTIKFSGFLYQSTNFKTTFNWFIKSYCIDLICTAIGWEGAKSVKDWDIL